MYGPLLTAIASSGENQNREMATILLDLNYSKE